MKLIVTPLVREAVSVVQICVKGVQRVARRWRVVTLALEQVGSVHPGRGHVDQHLTGAWLGIGDLLPLQYFRPSWLSDDHGPHMNSRCCHSPSWAERWVMKH